MNKILKIAVILILSLSLNCRSEEYNSEYIQKLVNALPQGGKVQLPKGKFKINKTIIVKSGIKIYGHGKETILLLDSSLKGPAFTNSDWRKGNSNIQISSMLINGNGDNMKLSDYNYHKRAYAKNIANVDNVAVYFKKCKDTIIDNVEFKYFRNEAIMLISTSKVIVSANHFLDCSRKGERDDWAQGARVFTLFIKLCH